jgi:site-specific DNA recombinase
LKHPERPNNVIAIGYIRISTKDQSVYSLEAQERRVREYCEANKLTLAALFRDDGESSYTFDRPDWKALEAFIKKDKRVTHLIIPDHDRFSRNLAEALLKIKELQDKYNIKVLATTDNIDTDFSDPTTFMMRAFKLMIAESELHGIRKRTKTGMQQANLNGRFTSKAPIGYINARDDNGKPILVIDEIKAPVIRLLFKLYAQGESIEEIRRQLASHGFRPKGNSTIQRTLSNPVYAGLINVHASKKIVKGLHSPIISETDYWNVQERLHGRHSISQRREEVPLRGVLRCWCGRKLTAGRSKGKTKYYWYYRCMEHGENLSAVKLHEQFNSILAELSLSPEVISVIREKLFASINTRLQDQGNNIHEIQKKLKTVQQRISSLEEKYLKNPDISEASYRSAIRELKQEEGKLQQQFAEANTDISIYWKRLDELLPKLVNLRVAFDEMPLDNQQRFIKVVFNNSLMYQNDGFRTHYLLDIFSDKELALNKKGLLRKEQPLPKIGVTPLCAPGGN